MQQNVPITPRRPNPLNAPFKPINPLLEPKIKAIRRDFIKRILEEQADSWVVRGTCPIDLEGHKWAEGFTVILDLKGKIKTTDFALL